MLLKWILRNKYKLMALTIGLYLIADIFMHKGLARVLLPDNFPAYKTAGNFSQNKNQLANTNKEWVKAVDTKELMDKLPVNNSGFECDVYFDREKNTFDVHHDPDNSTGLDLITLLEVYRQKKMDAAIWLDLKNLNDSNYKSAVSSLLELRNEYGLQNKLLVESNRADLLTAFSNSGFYTSYYTPMFNPYQMEDSEIKQWVDSLAKVIIHSKVNALSGYYFQYPFLHHYFPKYPLLTWAEKEKFSLINWLFRRQIKNHREVFIVLYPQ